MTNEISSSNLPIDRAEVLQILTRFADWAKDRDDREFTAQLHGQIKRIDELPPVVLRWSSDKPTVPGWYWVRKDASYRAEIAELGEYGFYPANRKSDSYYGEELNGHQFAGPIQEPV